MDSSSLASVVSGLAGAQSGSAAGTLVLKKALDLQAQNAQQLIAALPPPNNPPNLGKGVDTFA